MRIKFSGRTICVEESFVIVLFVCLLSHSARDYFTAYYICYLFIAFHELAHMTAATLFGIYVRRINIRVCGLSINLADKLDGIKAICIYCAGPLSNLLLAVIFKDISLVFEINICLALINLIPLKPLDGYNILNVMVCQNIRNVISRAAEIMLLILGITMFVKYCNISLLFLLIYIKLEKLNSAISV